MEIKVIIAIIVALAVGFALTRKRKDKKPDVPPSRPWVPPVSDDPPDSIKPAPVVPTPGPVLLDRNRKSPGDPGYDPRAGKPDPAPSPGEPFGTFYGEGPFDPFARYIDLHGRFHNP